jgi:hypothetical protein
MGANEGNDKGTSRASLLEIDGGEKYNACCSTFFPFSNDFGTRRPSSYASSALVQLYTRPLFVYFCTHPTHDHNHDGPVCRLSLTWPFR